MKRSLYIAYGSNLNKQAMQRRCPDARPQGMLWLSNARLVFRGVADVAYEPGQMCPVGLWAVSAMDEVLLDRYEGVSAGFYQRYHVPVRGKQALLYMMNDTGIYPPSRHYVDVVRAGYKDFGLDESYLDEAIEHSFNEKAPTWRTEWRRRRQRRGGVQRELVPMPEAVAMARMENSRQ